MTPIDRYRRFADQWAQRADEALTSEERRVCAELAEGYRRLILRLQRLGGTGEPNAVGEAEMLDADGDSLPDGERLPGDDGDVAGR